MSPQLSEGNSETQFQKVFEGGIDVVLDYLWGESARSILIAGAKFGPDARRIRFVQIGSMSGGDIALPSAVLRSSAIELMGSGMGSVSVKDLISSIGAMLELATKARLQVATRTAPLMDIEGIWNEEGTNRVVFTI